MRKFILIICISILGFSCDKDDQNNNTNEFIFPLNIGNYWNYKVTVSISNMTDYLGNELNDTTLYYDLFVNVEDSISENGQKKYQVTSRRSTHSETFYVYPYNDSEGLKLHYYVYSYIQFFPSVHSSIYASPLRLKSSQIETKENDELIIKYPLKIGDTWELSLDLGSGKYEILTKKVVAKEIITINNNDFECYKIKYTYDSDPTIEIYDYINTVGLVKRITKKKGTAIIGENSDQLTVHGDIIIIRELQEYEIY